MQIIHTSPLLAQKKKQNQEVYGQQKERRKKIVNVGDHVKCPQCGAISRVVWISPDEKQAGIRCPRSHTQLIRGESLLGSTARPQTKQQRNMVFLTEIASIVVTSSAQRL